MRCRTKLSLVALAASIALLSCLPATASPRGPRNPGQSGPSQSSQFDPTGFWAAGEPGVSEFDLRSATQVELRRNGGGFDMIVGPEAVTYMPLPGRPNSYVAQSARHIATAQPRNPHGMLTWRLLVVDSEKIIQFANNNFYVIKRLSTPAPNNGNSGNPTQPSGSPEATRLFQLINEYRVQNGLPAVAFSPSLTRVASLHVEDSARNPNQGLHAWSFGDARWRGGDPNLSPFDWTLMWDKPRELTSYRGDGYEISAMAWPRLTPEQALHFWKHSPPHNDVILERGIWAGANFKALGVGMQNGYAHAWFGKERDQ